MNDDRTMKAKKSWLWTNLVFVDLGKDASHDLLDSGLELVWDGDRRVAGGLLGVLVRVVPLAHNGAGRHEQHPLDLALGQLSIAVLVEEVERGCDDGEGSVRVFTLYQVRRTSNDEEMVVCYLQASLQRCHRTSRP